MRIEYRIAAFAEIRTSPEARALVTASAEAVAAAAGEGFEVLPDANSPVRAKRLVAAVTPKARAENARNQTLLKSLDAGRV